MEVLDTAKESITISCFGITNKMIGMKLMEKHLEGVKVLVLEDKLQSKGRADLGGYLASRGIEVVVKKRSALEHNKMVVVDGKVAIIGSWNLSDNANGQDNSMVITDDPEVVKSAQEAMARIYARDK
jgi:phosphatidylserine/phosphatidylglycerophosphate/cardiolipin synthase-like enzyme